MANKEIHYFSRYPNNPPNWYQSFFDHAENQPVVGERSNTYFCDAQAIQRIKALLPSVRLLAVLRNPVDRAYSNYCMNYRDRTVTESIDQVLDPDLQLQTGPNLTLEQGFYFKHTERLYQTFPRSNIKIMFFEELKANPEEFLSHVCDFLNVKSNKPDSMSRKPENVRPHSEYSRLVAPLVEFAEQLRFTHYLVQKIGPRARAALKRKLKTRPISYPPLSDLLKAKLAAYYYDDIRQLESLVERDLSQWCQVR